MKDKERRKNKSSDHLISVYLKLKKEEHDENESDRTDVWVRSFLRFCAIVYGFFILDVILPSQQIHDKIVDIEFSKTISGTVQKSNDGYNYLSKAMSIITNSGYITTLAVTGYEQKGEKALVGRSLLFSRVKYMYIGKYPFAVTPAINFFGWAFFMPLLAFIAGIYGGFFSKKIGSILFLGAVNVLLFIPFVMVLFLI